MTKLQEKADELKAKQKKLATVFDEAGPERDFTLVKSLGDIDSKAKVDKVREMSKELNDLVDELKKLQDIDKADQQMALIEKFLTTPASPYLPPVQGHERKTLGRLFTESDVYKSVVDIKSQKVNAREFTVNLPEVGMKALFEDSAGWPPQSLRIPGLVIPFATRPIQVLDLIPPGTTTYLVIKYMLETTFTNAAAETAEAGQYPEAALALTEETSNVEKLAVTLPVTDEQLADVPQAESYINMRLPFMLRQRLDGQILVGNGVAPNLQGIVNTPNVQIYAQAGADSMEDAIFKSITQVRFTGWANPNAVVIHPLDWQSIRLHRTTEGMYIWGFPGEAVPDRIWGLPVAMGSALSQGTAVIGDFANFCQLFERTGIDIQVGYVNDDFIKGRRAIRGDTRQAFVVYRPAAFCLATGLV